MQAMTCVNASDDGPCSRTLFVRHCCNAMCVHPAMQCAKITMPAAMRAHATCRLVHWMLNNGHSVPIRMHEPALLDLQVGGAAQTAEGSPPIRHAIKQCTRTFCHCTQSSSAQEHFVTARNQVVHKNILSLRAIKQRARTFCHCAQSSSALEQFCHCMLAMLQVWIV